MAWLKRNLGLVLTGVVALALLGLAGYFLWTKKGKADGIAEELTAKTEELKRLYNRAPGATPENIQAAKEEQVKLEAFLKELRSKFPTPQVPEQLSNRDFGALLSSTISSLRRLATNSGVALPSAGYQFSFASQMKAVNTPTNLLSTLALQLADVETISRVIFQAKVNAIEGVKRSTVTSDEIVGTDFISQKPTTNDYTVVTPYEFVFKCFSSELASVFEGLVKASNCIVVRQVVVERADSSQNPSTTSTGSGSEATVGGMPASLASRYGFRPGMGGSSMPPGLASRYGMAGRPTPPPAPTPTPGQTAGARGPSTLLNEQPLKVTLSLDTVRVRPAGKLPKAAPTPAAEGAPATEAPAEAAQPAE